VVYDYWAAHLDPLRARRTRDGSPLKGRTAIVTGASSGIGRTTSLEIAERGGIPLCWRGAPTRSRTSPQESQANGGQAGVYSGRSIRLSYDRCHALESTPPGPCRLLPHPLPCGA
jgi:hypothetical protein